MEGASGRERRERRRTRDAVGKEEGEEVGARLSQPMLWPEREYQGNRDRQERGLRSHVLTGPFPSGSVADTDVKSRVTIIQQGL